MNTGRRTNMGEDWGPSYEGFSWAKSNISPGKIGKAVKREPSKGLLELLKESEDDVDPITSGFTPTKIRIARCEDGLFYITVEFENGAVREVHMDETMIDIEY
jgi:hypothetical protein